ncbi:MAG: UvrD-helicase domain-containing protein, partial [Promethearchaeota archaeon]
LIERVDNIRRQYGVIVKLINSFITTAKSNYLSIKDIKNNLHSRSFKKNYTRRRIMLFTQIALKVFESYERYLSAHSKIDFNDMINRAIEFAKNKKEKYLEKYRYILVDEFQDISYQRIELLKTFINDYNNCKMFCVGDDWQSIYQFNGSIVNYFVDFAKYFRNPTIVYLPTNYRSTRNIVDAGNKLIKKNKMQIRKTIKSHQGYGVTPLLFEIRRIRSLSGSSKTGVKRKVLIYYNLISFLIKHNVKPNEIMVISRFTRILKELEILCGANGIPTEMHHGGIRFYTAHKSKGDEAKHVIIIDVISGMFGFPSEIQDSSVLEVARRIKANNYIEEERRLFYVALTRSKKFLYIFTNKNKNSMFLDEIKDEFIQINIYNSEPWEENLYNNMLSNNYRGISKRNWNKSKLSANENKALSYFLKDYINEKPDYDMICPECGRVLLVKHGKYGSFISCSGSPRCKYKRSYDS